MFRRHAVLARASALALALNVLGVTVAAAGPSDCTDWAVGGQTGDLYELVGQSEVTETRTISLEGGACGLSAGSEVTYQETYHVGTYTNTSTNATVQVNCSTGEVIG